MVKKIKKLEARTIFNSQGGLTLEAKLTTTENKTFTASIPEGLSRGREEAAYLSPPAALTQIRQKLIPPLLVKTPSSQEELDAFLLLKNCAANATLPISLVFAKAFHSFPLPRPIRKRPKLMMLIFEGGKHGNKKIKIQEFMLIVNRFETGKKIFDQTQKYLLRQGLSITTGAEGGFSPPGLNDHQVLKLLTRLVGKKYPLAIDIANNHAHLTSQKLSRLINSYPALYSLEDPAEETKIDLWKKVYQQWGQQKQIVGDDLTVTDPEKIKTWGGKLFNAVVIKPNQQKTMTQARLAVKAAQNLKLKVIVSHRGTDTNEDFIADFALSVEADYVKFGAPNRGERIAKYNRLRELLP